MKQDIKQFKNHLRRRGFKYTRSREEILEAICAYPGHFDVENLIFHLRKQGSRVSRGTVYRTIPLLVEAKILRSVAFTDRHAHYESTVRNDHHDHLICLHCGKVFEFYRGKMEAELEDVCRENNFHPVGHKMEITGYCSKCKQPRSGTAR